MHLSQATFKITVQAHVDQIVLSNIPSTEEKCDRHLRIVSFQESPVMSTYLVAIVVGEFEYIEQTTTTGVCSYILYRWNNYGRSVCIYILCTRNIHMHTCMKDKFRISYRIGEFIYFLVDTLYSMLWMIAGNKVRVYCENGKSNQGRFSLNFAVITLPY